MCPPDPERDPYEDDEEAEEPAADAHDLDALKLRGDVPALLALAKACRSGSAPGGRDMKKCFDAYQAAAALGSAEAEYAVALFFMNGGAGVVQDLKEGATHLRAAAEKGSVPAKVYVGNMYELGIHYKADPEKADVWYRNAARSARVEATPGGDEWTRALADLGCARHALALTKDDTLDEAEKARLLARAKAHGYGLRVRDEAAAVLGDAPAGDRATFVDALAGAEASASRASSAGSGAATATPPPVAVELPLRERKDTTPDTKTAKEKAAERTGQAEKAEKAERAKEKGAARGGASARAAAGLAAFGYAILFVLAGMGAGYAAMLGARELVARGHVLPLVGTNVRLVFALVLGLVGVLPAWLVYRFGAFAKALVVGAAFGGIGWVAWGTGQAALHPDRALQALGFALAGFLSGLLALGLLGGTKHKEPRTRA